MPKPCAASLTEQRLDLAEQPRQLDRLGVEVVAAGRQRISPCLSAMAWAVSAITGMALRRRHRP